MNASPVVLAAAVAAVAALVGPPSPPLRTKAGPVLPRPGFVHALFAAQRNLVADYFWVLTTHQIGAAVTPEQMRDVYAYADLATSLDPNFVQVYWFAGVALPVQTARNQYANAQESTAILEKGARVAPRNFKIKYQLAQNYLYLQRDYPRAAALLKEVSSLPGAPSWLPSLAMRAYAEGGSLETSLELATHLAANADDEESRAFYATRLQEIQQEFVLRRIDEAAALFAERTSRPPSSLQELRDNGFLPDLPPDPLGGEYFIDADSGRAKSTASKHRFELIRMPDAPASAKD